MFRAHLDAAQLAVLRASPLPARELAKRLECLRCFRCTGSEFIMSPSISIRRRLSPCLSLLCATGRRVDSRRCPAMSPSPQNLTPPALRVLRSPATSGPARLRRSPLRPSPARFAPSSRRRGPRCSTRTRTSLPFTASSFTSAPILYSREPNFRSFRSTRSAIPRDEARTAPARC